MYRVESTGPSFASASLTQSWKDHWNYSCSTKFLQTQIHKISHRGTHCTSDIHVHVCKCTVKKHEHTHTHPLQTPVEDHEVRVGWTKPFSHPHLLLLLLIFLFFFLVERVLISGGLALRGLGGSRSDPAITSRPQLLHPEWRERAHNKLSWERHDQTSMIHIWESS